MRGNLFRAVVLLCLAASGLAGAAEAAPYGLSWGGRLTDTSGKPLDGPVEIHLAFYRTETGGSPLASGPVIFQSVPLKEGVFSVTVNLAPDEFHQIFSSVEDPVYIEITDVTHAVTYPRQPLTVLPYALKIPVDGQTLGYDADGKLKVNADNLVLQAAKVDSLQLTDSSGSSHAISLKAPSNVPGNVIYTLPATPSAGGFLSTDAAGNLTWAAPSFTAVNAAAISSGSVSNTEFGFLDGVTSAIQTQLDGKAAKNFLDAADGSPTKAVFVDNNGNVGVGTINPSGLLHLSSDNGSTYLYLDDNNSTGPGYSTTLWQRRARGSAAARTAVSSGDTIGQWAFQGYDGTAFRNAADIATEVDGTPGANDMPGRIVFYTTPDGSATLAERMRITNAGDVGLGTTSPNAKLQVNAATTASIGAIFRTTDDNTTKNLTEWQNSSGNTLGAVSSDGKLLSIGQNTATKATYVGTGSNTQITGSADNVIIGYKADTNGYNSTAGIGIFSYRSALYSDAYSYYKMSFDSAPDGYVFDRFSYRVTLGQGSENATGSDLVGFRLKQTRIDTSGAAEGSRFTFTFSPTSGTATFNSFELANTINQTGGANGIVRDIYVNPTLTSATDYRAVEISNNAGYALYQTGASAQNYLAGKIGIGTVSPSRKLDVNDDGIRIRTAKTPATSGDPCDQGDIAWDANYVYVCVAANTWKRSALTGGW